MPAKRPELRRGRIVWGTVVDKRGDKKSRPAVIWTPTDQIKPDRPLVVLAITTTFPDPPPEDHILLPRDPKKRAGTGLTKRSAVVLTWFDQIQQEGLEFKGEVPAKLIALIEEKINAMRKKSDPA